MRFPHDRPNAAPFAFSLATVSAQIGTVTHDRPNAAPFAFSPDQASNDGCGACVLDLGKLLQDRFVCWQQTGSDGQPFRLPHNGLQLRCFISAALYHCCCALTTG
jgi:hypothetical protein